MFCPNCGKEENDPDARFCNNCGEPLKREYNTSVSQHEFQQQTASIHAGFFLRLIAAIIDTILFAILLGVLSLGRGVGMWQTHAMQGVPAIIGLLIYAAFESSNMMGTPGKYFLKIAVVDINRQRVSFGRAFLRNICKYLSALIFFIGYLMIAFTKEKQGLHDMIAGTYVIKRER